MRDDTPFAGADPPAALFRYSRTRSGSHPVEHLRGFAGLLQADAYAGFNPLYAPGRVPGPVIEALCWAYVAARIMLRRAGIDAPAKRIPIFSAT